MTPRVEVVVTGVATAIAGVSGVADLLRPAPARVDADPADPVAGLKGRGMRYKDRATKLALCAARDALADAGLPAAPDADDFGVVVSSNLGNIDTVCQVADTIARETYLGTSPMDLPGTASNVIAAWVAITHGLRGANLTLCNGPTSGLDAMHWARLLIAAGRVSRVLVIGVEPVNEQVRHLTDPAGTGRRLFDGAAAVILESSAAAAARAVEPRAVVGRYARRVTPAEAIAEVRGEDPVKIGYCSLPADGAFDAGADCGGDSGLADRFGVASGALGVLQSVAGVAWFADGGSGSVLAVAGAGRPVADASAALILGEVR